MDLNNWMSFGTKTEEDAANLQARYGNPENYSLSDRVEIAEMGWYRFSPEEMWAELGADDELATMLTGLHGSPKNLTEDELIAQYGWLEKKMQEKRPNFRWDFKHWKWIGN